MLQGVAAIGTVILLAGAVWGILRGKNSRGVKEIILEKLECAKDRPRRKVPLICEQKRAKDWSEYGMVKLMNAPHR